MRRLWGVLGSKLSVPVWAFALLIIIAVAGILAGQTGDDDEPLRQETSGVTTSPVTAPAFVPDTEPPTTTTTKSRELARVGSTHSLAGNGREQMDVTLVKVVDPAPARQYDRPREGRYVAVQLRLANTGPAPYEDSPSNGAKLVDEQGQVYRSTISDSAAGPGFGGSVSIPPGESRLGFITFDAPESVKASKFEFTLNSGFGPETGAWTIS